MTTLVSALTSTFILLMLAGGQAWYFFFLVLVFLEATEGEEYRQKVGLCLMRNLGLQYNKVYLSKSKLLCCCS